MTRRITFTHTFPFSASTALQPRRRPVVPVRIFNIRDSSRFLDLRMLVDSGADTTCLPVALASPLGIDLATLPTISTRGVSGATSAYRHDDLSLAIAGVAVRCPAVFVPGLPTFLLGRAGIFDAFVFAFEGRTGHTHVCVSPS